MRPTLKRYLSIIVILLFLSACNLRQLYTHSPQTTYQPTLTQLATPTSPTALPLNIETLGPTPTSTSLPFVTVDGLLVAYISDGNLYIQDSGGQSVQLTHNTGDKMDMVFPVFSDDGEKILFRRDKAYTYSLININDSQEQILLPNISLIKLNLGYGKYTELCNLDFIPGTHNLLFKTCEAKPWSDGVEHTTQMEVKLNQDMLILNTDTMGIRQVLAPGKGSGIFHLSPDKKLDMDYTRNYIDLVGTYGQIDRRHMITYLPEWDNEWTEALWSQDSSKFIFVAPINGNSDGSDGYLADTIWQYSIKKNAVVKIHLNPPPVGNNYIFSPDGNWIVYGYPDTYSGKIGDGFPIGLYIGNLQDGSSRLITPDMFYGLRLPEPNQWSPDSKHFFFYNDGLDKMYLGNINGDITILPSIGLWVGWLDNQRYIYKKDSFLVMGEINRDEAVPVVSLPAGFKELPAKYFTYIFLKSK